MSRKRSTTLTDHELRLMNPLWEQRRMTVEEIVRVLPPPKLAYSTVLTTMRTLESKKYVTHERVGRAFVYSPAIERAEAASQSVSALIDRFFDGSRGALLAAVLEDRRLSSDEIEGLARLVKKRAMTTHRSK